MLQQGSSVALPVQLLLVRVQGPDDDGRPQLDAVVVRGPGREDPATDLERHPGTLVLAVTDTTTIRLRPPPGETVFRADSVFSVSIGGEGPDAEQVVLSSVDTSGMRQRDLVTLQPAGDETVVTALTETSESPLPPLAARARQAARALLADTRGAEQRVALQVVVDGSASMRPHLRSDRLERVLELVMGAVQSICSGSQVACSVCAQSRSEVRAEDLTSFSGSLAAAAARRPPAIGFRSALVPEGGDGTFTYLVTDGVPADLRPARSDHLHLVILAARGYDPSPLLPSGVLATVITVPAGDASDQAGSSDATSTDGGTDEPQLSEIVSSLLSGYRQRSTKGQP
jgi:hypothetical protein